MDNYRAAERTFSLLTCGEAGRAGQDKTGRAVIQTYTPGNDVIRCAARQDYDAFYESDPDAPAAAVSAPADSLSPFPERREGRVPGPPCRPGKRRCGSFAGG